MILASTKVDFDALADKVVQGMASGGEKLADLVVKVAMENELNPEEVRRLVQHSNTAATLHLLKTSADKKAEIDLADYDDVFQRTHGVAPAAPETPAAEKTAGEIPLHLPNTRKAAILSGVIMPKIAAEATSPKERPMAVVFRLQRDIEELRRRKIATELSIHKQAEQLVSIFDSYQGPDFDKFACEALTLHGDSAVPMLEALARALDVTPELNKVAYIIDERTPLLNKFAAIQHALTELVEISRELTKKSLELGAAWANTGASNRNGGATTQ